MKRLNLLLLMIFVAAVVAAAQNLPKPTGPFQIGTTVLHFTDRTRKDTNSSKADVFRELMIQVWYPADSTEKVKSRASYIPNSAILRAFIDEQYNSLSQSVIESLKDVRVSAFLDIPVSSKQRKYPMIIFSPGLGEPRSNYTALAQDLASHGYIVVTVDHPYGGFTALPDGRVLSTGADERGGTPEGSKVLVEEWAQDVSFIVNRFNSPTESDLVLMRQIAERIDLKEIGMLGHSLGGATALEICRIDLRFRACADLDGAPFGLIKEVGIQRPTLIMRSDPVYSDDDLAKKGRTREQWEQTRREVKMIWDSILPRNKEIPLYTIKIAGAGHMTFSDAPFTMPTTITRFGGRIIEPNLSFEIISSYLRDFFDKYLRNRKSKLLDNLRSPHPEALIEKVNL